jgi:cytidylate kinase
MIIAIDGPAASGKGTLGRRMAAHYGLHHLDTGLLYRAVASLMMDDGASLSDEALAVAAAHRVRIDRLDPAALAEPRIGEAASRIAALSGLRAALLDHQRRFAGRAPGAVLDGRDIGTVICPDADVKIFLVASPEVRARRRAAQLSRTAEADYRAILADILRRDERDMNRVAAPLRPADDAHLLDTSQMDIEAAFRAAVDIVDRALQAQT